MATEPQRLALVVPVQLNTQAYRAVCGKCRKGEIFTVETKEKNFIEVKGEDGKKEMISAPFRNQCNQCKAEEWSPLQLPRVILEPAPLSDQTFALLQADGTKQ